MEREILLRRLDLILMHLKLFVLEIWIFLKKRNPNLGITMLFRARKPVDIIIITRGNRGHPHPRNPRGLAKGIF
jgi:hypothetical protein